MAAGAGTRLSEEAMNLQGRPDRGRSRDEWAVVLARIKNSTPTERAILTFHHGLGGEILTFNTIGRRLGVTRNSCWPIGCVPSQARPRGRPPSPLDLAADPIIARGHAGPPTRSQPPAWVIVRPEGPGLRRPDAGCPSRPRAGEGSPPRTSGVQRQYQPVNRVVLALDWPARPLPGDRSLRADVHRRPLPGFSRFGIPCLAPAPARMIAGGLLRFVSRGDCLARLTENGTRNAKNSRARFLRLFMWLDSSVRQPGVAGPQPALQRIIARRVPDTPAATSGRNAHSGRNDPVTPRLDRARVWRSVSGRAGSTRRIACRHRRERLRALAPHRTGRRRRAEFVPAQ